MFAVSFAMAIRSKYILYVFNQREKLFIMIDPRLVEEWCKDTSTLIYAKYSILLDF